MKQNNKIYGFIINKNKQIEIKAKNEQEATIKLVNEYWEIMDKKQEGEIIFLGELFKN